MLSNALNDDNLISQPDKILSCFILQTTKDTSWWKHAYSWS